MEYLSIDRIENGIAVCEDDNRKRREIPLAAISGTPREGDVLCFTEGQYRVDLEETARRRERAVRLQERLFGRE